MLTLLFATAAFAAEPATVEFDSPVSAPISLQQTVGLGRPTVTPLCTAPCTAEVPAGSAVIVRAQPVGAPLASKRFRFDPGEAPKLTVKPGKQALARTGTVLSAAGLIIVAAGVGVNAVNPGSVGLVWPIAGVGLSAVGLPISLIGSSKIKRVD